MKCVISGCAENDPENDSENESENDADNAVESNSDTLAPLSDEPLSWYGLTSSSSLQAAQTTFKSALERVVEICNMKQDVLISLDNFDLSLTEFKEKISIEDSDENCETTNEF